jgi:hypothetical protein
MLAAGRLSVKDGKLTRRQAFGRVQWPHVISHAGVHMG